MLRGIPVQLKSLSSYLETTIQNDVPLKWDSYFIHTQRATFQLLKLAQITLSQVQHELPNDCLPQFKKCIGLLKQYTSTKPKGEVDNDDYDESYRLDRMEYDQVQHFLENKPEIEINLDQRGELYKFLAQNEQKEKNNQILLDSIPKYSFNFQKLPQVQTKGVKRQDSIQKMEPINVRSSVLTKQEVLGRKGVEREVQTEVTLPYSKNICFVEIENQGEIGDGLKNGKCSASKKGSIGQNIENIPKIQGENKSNRNSKGSTKRDTKPIQSQKQSNSKQSAQTIQTKKQNLQTNAINDLLEYTHAQQHNEQGKPQQKKEKKQKQHRFSRAQQQKSKKDISKAYNNQRSFRKSKQINLKQNIKPMQSKFRKQKAKKKMDKNQTTDQQTQKSQLQLQKDTGYNIVILKKTDSQLGIQINQNESYDNKPRQSYQPRESICSRFSSDINSMRPFQQSIERNSKDTQLVKQEAGKQGERFKIISNKQQNKAVQPDLSSYSNTVSAYLYPKKVSQAKRYENSLPKIEQRHSKYQKQSQQKYITKSPYAKSIYKNSSISNENLRSLHLNPLQSNRKNYTKLSSEYERENNRISGTFYQQSINKGRSLELMDLPSNQSAGDANWDLEQLNIVKKIEQNVIRKGKSKWDEVIGLIGRYQQRHIAVCGDNCIHLNKFYEFLKRNKLNKSLLRRQLILHKKNIAIEQTK